MSTIMLGCGLCMWVKINDYFTGSVLCQIAFYGLETTVATVEARILGTDLV